MNLEAHSSFSLSISLINHFIITNIYLLDTIGTYVISYMYF